MKKWDFLFVEQHSHLKIRHEIIISCPQSGQKVPSLNG